MSVIVKGMEMPESCRECPLCVDELLDDNDQPCAACFAMPDTSPWGCGYKEIDGIDHTKERMPWCPLIELRQPHGRLIDADELKDKYSGWYNMIDGKSIRAVQAKEIDWMPTVIEAEGSE